MFEVTETAVSNLKQYFEENKINSPVRVALMQSCHGSSLGLGLDEANDGDKVIEQDGLKFVIAEDLLAKCGTVQIDFVEAGYQSGFTIKSQNEVGSTGGGCASCGGSCH